MNLLALSPALLLLAAAEPARVASADVAPAERASVVALLEAHDDAWNRHDAEAQTRLFTEDGTLVTPAGTRAAGHEALRRVFSADGPTKKTSSKTTLDHVQRLDENLLLVDARQELTGPGTASLGANHARIVAILRRDGGRWRMLAVRPAAVARPAASVSAR